MVSDIFHFHNKAYLIWEMIQFEEYFQVGGSTTFISCSAYGLPGFSVESSHNAVHVALGFPMSSAPRNVGPLGLKPEGYLEVQDTVGTVTGYM